MRVVSLLWLLLAPGTLSTAALQLGRGELQVEVRDRSGSLVQSASLSLTDNATGETYTRLTNAQGICTFTDLRPGLYSLIIEMSGFHRFSRTDLQVATGERVRVDAQLEVGEISQSITVNSSVPILDAESGSLGQVVGKRMILAIPLNGRNFVPVVGLAAGVALPAGS